MALALLIAGAASASTSYYDALGRIVQVVYDNGVVVTYTYDSAGNRTMVSTPAAATTFWDAFSWDGASWQ